MIRSCILTLSLAVALALPVGAQFSAQSWPGANYVVDNDRPGSLYEITDGRLVNVEPEEGFFINATCPLPQIEAHLTPVEYRVVVYDPGEHPNNVCRLVDAGTLEREGFVGFDYEEGGGISNGEIPGRLHFHTIECILFPGAELVGYELLLKR